jgi:hypothetical protein
MASAASPLHGCEPPPASYLDTEAGKGEGQRAGEEPSASEPFHGEPRAHRPTATEHGSLPVSLDLMGAELESAPVSLNTVMVDEVIVA